MGTYSSIPNYNSNVVFQNFREEDWELIENDNQDDIDVDPYGDFTTLQNTITKEQIDLYSLYFRSKQELHVYIQCFMQRTREDYLVNAIYLQPNKTNQFCSSIYTAKCYIQHMPIRLSGITDIPFSDTLYMLWCALHGFEKLFNTVGYFSVHEDHICIDKQGLVRVWMNCDLSKNYPQGYEDLGLSIERQNTMVDEILEIIFNNSEEIDTQQNPNLIPFSEYIQKKGHKNPTFKQALHLLFRYLKDYDIQLPTYCQSIIEIFNDEGDDYFLPNNDSGIERMLDNKPNFSRSLQQIDEYKLSDFSESKVSEHSQSIHSNNYREPVGQKFGPNESNSNNSNYFKHSYKEQLHSNLVVVKKSIPNANNRSSQHSKKSFRHSLRNRSSASSVNHKKIINVPNINNTSQITSKIEPEDFNYLEMSEIHERKEQGLRNHHRLQSNYQGSYHTSKRNSSSYPQKQAPKFTPEPVSPHHYIDSGRGNHSRNTGSYAQEIDRCRGSAPMTLMPDNQHLLSTKFNGYLIQPLDQNDDKKSSFFFNNSNAQNQVIINEQTGERRPPRINFVYTNSVYNCSSNCNSLRDNTFSVNQWNAQYKMINKLRKKSEEYTVGFRKKKRTVSSMRRQDEEERREEQHAIDPQILADLQKLRVEEVK